MTDRGRSVALDVSAVPASPAGAGRYIVELARALDRAGAVDLTLVARRGDGERWGALAPHSRLCAPVPAPRPARLAYERLGLARRVGALTDPAVEIYHGPHYTFPAGLRTAVVVTVHDLTFIEHPEWHERAKVPFFSRAIRRAAAEADVVVCVSTTTAGRLRELVDVRAELVVAEHGVDHRRFSPGPPEVSLLPAEARGELVVHVGTLEPRKGLVELVGAFDRLAATRPDLRLVLAGQPGWGAAALEEAVRSAHHRDRIVRLGFVPDEVVVALLRSAAVVAYPSREEGFGLPALEALAAGALLVTTAGTAMAEFAGAAALLAPPGDAEALAGTLLEALDLPAAERAARVNAGVAQAARFTWEATATAHLRAYELAAERAARRRRGAL